MTPVAEIILGVIGAAMRQKFSEEKQRACTQTHNRVHNLHKKNSITFFGTQKSEWP